MDRQIQLIASCIILNMDEHLHKDKIVKPTRNPIFPMVQWPECQAA